MRAARGRSFKVAKWELYVERQARLQNKRLGEDRGGRFHPDGLVTYVFSRLRCKPTACRVEAGLFSGAGVARRRAFDDTKEIMSDTSTTTIGEQSDEQLRTSRSRQHRPNVMGGGVWCDGGAHHTSRRVDGRVSLSTPGTVVRMLGCEGCEGSNPNYRVVCECAPAPARLSIDRVCTPHTHHTPKRGVVNGNFSPSRRGLEAERCDGGVSPPPITPIRQHFSQGVNHV